MRKLLIAVIVVLSSPVLAKTMSAETFSPAQFSDATVIYLDFWASWCVPCRKSFPWLNAMQEKYADQGLRIVGINLDPKHSDAEKFLQFYPARFDLVFDPSGKLAQKWNLQGMPSAVIITPQGQVLERHIGFHANRAGDYEHMLQRLLEKEGP